jgi:peptide/nickel transport system ATP-binding protein
MLAVRNLSVAFRQHDGSQVMAVTGLDLTLSRGEVVGLVGGSGAGKSVVADALMGILPRNAVQGGTITLDGGGRIALAPQGIDALDPLVPVGRQIDRLARLSGRKVDAAAVLRDLDLGAEVMEAWPHMLSGGMAKRALIATALATGAAFLIADEQTLGLDPETADRIMALLAGLAQGGAGVLVITHDLPRLVGVAARITVLQEGRAVETAPAADFTADRLRHPFARALWSAQSGRL